MLKQSHGIKKEICQSCQKSPNILFLACFRVPICSYASPKLPIYIMELKIYIVSTTRGDLHIKARPPHKC